MGEILLYYERPDPTTWVYLSSFLTIGLFFVFHRVWSVRNLDLILLILLAPGLRMVTEGYQRQLTQLEVQVELPPDPLESDADRQEPGADRLDRVRSGRANAAVQFEGFLFLFLIELLLVIRMMVDPLMVRRPRLDPNLTTGGFTFIGISLFIFMMANVVNSDASVRAVQGPSPGPGYPLMNMLPAIPTRPIRDAAGEGPTVELPITAMREATGENINGLSADDAGLRERTDRSGATSPLAALAKSLAIAAHLAIVSGLVLVSNRHFGNFRVGMGLATLYLMMPYTAQMTGRVDHALPAALLLWAVLFYRRPLLAGTFLGLAGGLVYYPLFLLPLWMSFYWRRGVCQFVTGVAAMLVVLMLLVATDSSNTLTGHLQQMFGILDPNKDASQLGGFWAIGWNPIWRLPVIVAFVILSFLFSVWPSQKNLGTLLSGSAAIMAAAQFWHGYGGGLYIAWFLPLLLLAIFRPNLQDRVATKVVRLGEKNPAPASVGI